jgi:hypothetical protein
MVALVETRRSGSKIGRAVAAFERVRSELLTCCTQLRCISIEIGLYCDCACNKL